MIVEERCYALLPKHTVSEYLAIYQIKGLEIQQRHLGRLLGYFSSETGTLNQVVHLWGYDSFEDRLERRARLASDPQWQVYLELIRPMLKSMQNRILLPASFSPIR